ncbi:hypothetical protein [Legionella erythra]|uniref:Substrate of the Dot/Icm secretion system n=1 Tax=Legionella erythra TaxID=448 RepID=A0A0W0TF03_LEGER|nr:hypothetical protein [Legionella erythra]KTC94134.1 substrate of the Dot/Icm secretion system [Legionella erythra]
MTYCLDDEFLKNLLEIREEYSKIKQIDFAKAPQPYAISCFFGATDVSTRDQQTRFILKMLDALKEDLLKPSQLEKENFLLVKPEAIEKHVEALRILVALVFYIKSQVDKTYTVGSSSSAKLIMLLDNALKLSQISIDDETRDTVLHSAQKFLNNDKKLEEINSKMKSKISDSEWRDFTRFINHQCKKLDTKSKASLPVTSVLVPALAWPMEMTGYTTGYILGNVIAKSTESQPVRAFVTTSLSALLYFFTGSSGTLGIMLVAPTYAGKLVETFSGISCAWMLANTMKYAGKGMGYVIGVPIDLGCKVAYQSAISLSSILQGKKAHHLTGFNLVTGQRVIEGTEVNFIKTDDETLKQVFAKGSAESDGKIPVPPVQLTSEGLIFKRPDGEEIKVAIPTVDEIKKAPQPEKLPYMEELKSLLEGLIQQNGIPLIKATTGKEDILQAALAISENELTTATDQLNEETHAQNMTV